jgi:hypothetical protein
VDIELAASPDPVVLCLTRAGVCAGGEVKSIGVPSKSQETPCLEQFPHTGCTSSHYRIGQ